jgi:hypothetical protein
MTHPTRMGKYNIKFEQYADEYNYENIPIAVIF